MNALDVVDIKVQRPRGGDVKLELESLKRMSSTKPFGEAKTTEKVELAA
jgi:hypothetical protein